ncbi:DUF4157 domain-containing protein [Streptosporangium canum]|uniref:eCIS core domain-containing protein n=1 Tax=Streptosporangium canum TaxID=324952 RepID=UPI0033A9C8C5
MRTTVGSRAAPAAAKPAFTVGRDIVFAPGACAPHTAAGRHLIAHEPAHMVQGGPGPVIRRQANRPGYTISAPFEGSVNP